MKKSTKITIVTNILLTFITISIFAVCFVPNRSVAISGKDGYSPMYNGNRNSSVVSLMFNVYEGAETVEKILSLLKENEVKATFFIGGCWAEDNGELIVKILEEGHELGNHGYFHKDHKKLSLLENKREISACHKIVKSITGYDMKLFAPPSGSFNSNTLNAAMELGYTTIMWSKDTIDWRDKEENKIISRATKNLVGGDLILMHPKTHTLNALDDIIKEIRNKKLNADTVSVCIGEVKL